ncbi:MAG: hypothetical protein B0W54_08945 [Cellvibrio sp. 79]|nr:MAG: hypothetical protein B0W54_08945 [Cellvibrio sp. 79]
MGITIKKILSSKGFGLVGLMFGSTSSALVWSQVAPVDEVLVTAQMRAESAQNIPLAIGVYDKELIDQIGADSLTEMETAIPSLNFGSGDRNTRGEITIRGIGDYARNIGTNARVAVYIDGVLTGRSSSFDQGLLDVAHIEIVRGPQGTLSGTNALAGAINIITQKPEDTFSAELLANTGNYDLASVTGKVNVPLSDDLFASLWLGASEQDGYIRNLTLDRELQGASRDTAKLKFRYIGVDRLIVDVGFDYLKDDDKSTNAEALANGMFNGFTLSPEPFVVAHNADEFEQRELKGVTIEAVYETPDNYKWTSITGLRSNEFRELSEEDYSPLNVAVSVFDEQSDQISQEIRFASPRNESFDYVIGAYFLDQDISTERQAITGPVFVLAPNGRVQTPASAEVESASVFLHGNYYFDARWSLTAGVRYVNEAKNIDYSSIDSTKMFVNTSHLADQKTFNEWLPKLGLNFQMTPDVLLYTSVARGYKSGGWNADFITSLENFQFNPEYAVNYEVGGKSSFFDNRLTVNVSAFVTKFDDFQVFQFLPALATNGTVLSLTNAGKVTSRGFELDISAELTEHLRLSVNTASTSARFDEFKNGGGIGTDYDDHYLPYAPKNNYFIALDYTRPLFGRAAIYAHIDYGHTDDYFSNPNNLSDNKIPARDLTNARLGVKVDESWDVSLWVKNLADDTSLRQKSVSFLRVPRGVYNPPRTYGLELKYRFN